MDDLISRQATMKEFADFVRKSNNSDFAQTPTWNDAVSLVGSMPTAEPTLYGYKIEHLAYIARVMEKEGVTAEYAVRTFDDMSRAIKMILDEAQQKAEEMLYERFNQQTGGDRSRGGNNVVSPEPKQRNG